MNFGNIRFNNISLIIICVSYLLGHLYFLLSSHINLKKHIFLQNIYTINTISICCMLTLDRAINQILYTRCTSENKLKQSHGWLEMYGHYEMIYTDTYVSFGSLSVSGCGGLSSWQIVNCGRRRPSSPLAKTSWVCLLEREDVRPWR